MDARKEKIDHEAAWERLSKAEQVIIAQGKKILEFKPSSQTKDDILQKAMGRSGNLRAPTLLIEGVYYIGFNQAMYEDLFG